MMEKIYILLPVHNRKDITKEFIRCLLDQTYQNYHLILIDDGSIDGTHEMVRNHIQQLTTIRGNGNWWWAGSLQKGINWLKKNRPSPDDIILIINDDVEYEDTFLVTAVNILRSRKRTLLLAQFIDPETGSPVETGVEADLKNLVFKVATTPDRINCFSTRGLFMKWVDLLDIGDLHPILLPHYSSDYEFTIRAHKKGFKLYTTKELVLRPKLKETGIWGRADAEVHGLMAALFYKKSMLNPVYRTTFAILVSPWPYLLPNLKKVWYSTLKMVFVVLRKKIKQASGYRE